MQEGIILCEQVEGALAPIGAHVALGGSVLTKGESNKDLDLFIYPHKTREVPLHMQVVDALKTVGIVNPQPRPHKEYGDDKKVLAFEYQGKRVDVFLLMGQAQSERPMYGQWRFTTGAPINPNIPRVEFGPGTIDQAAVGRLLTRINYAPPANQVWVPRPPPTQPYDPDWNGQFGRPPQPISPIPSPEPQNGETEDPRPF